MSLKESLERFKRQQEKCQTTLSSIAASQSASRTSATQSHKATTNSSNVAPLAPNRPPAAPVKFSNDTERLQHINTIRKSPVGAQMKRVIDLLFETRQAFTPEQINEVCFVDVKSNRKVFDSLTNNPKVKYDGKRFSYKSKHELKNKDDLIRLIRKSAEGIAVVDMKDAYPDVVEHLQALRAEGLIWLLSNVDSQEDTAYPNDPRMLFKVDDELKQLFRSIDLPRDMLDVEKDLQKNGMRPATNTTKRRLAAQMEGLDIKPQAKKKKEISKRTKLTNAHLPELFRN